MDFTKIVELGRRIYNNKMIEQKDEAGKIVLSDEQAIRALCEKTFTKNGEFTTLEALRGFNSLIVEVADEEAQPRIQPILDAISNYAKVDRYDKKVYEVPKQARISMAVSATASGVDFVRISPGKTKQAAKPETHQFGCYYNIDKMVSDPVNEFRNAVNYVVEYKVKYYYTKINELVIAAKTSGKIPSGQVIETANIDFVDYRNLENKLLRYGRNANPVMIADRNLIDSLALKQATTTLGVSNFNGALSTDALKEEILRNAEITKVSRTIAIATDNPFTDTANTKVDLPVNEGLVLAGGDKSPFYITEFGKMRTAQGVPDIENERVNMKIDFRVDITLLFGSACAYVKDTAVTL